MGCKVPISHCLRFRDCLVLIVTTDLIQAHLTKDLNLDGFLLGRVVDYRALLRGGTARNCHMLCHVFVSWQNFCHTTC